MIDPLLIFSLIAIIVMTCGLIAGTTVDDFRDVRRRRIFKLHPHSRRYRARPLVTVLLIAGTDSSLTKEALRNLQKSSYRRLEFVLVCTTRSRATLKKLATSLTTPSRPVYVFGGKKSSRSNLDAGYRRYGHGDIVLVLRDSDRLDKAAIKHSVWHFNAQNDTSVLRAHITISTRYSTIGLLQTYTQSLVFFWNKLANILTRTYTPSDSGILFYRAEAFLARRSQPWLKTYTAEDIIAHRPAMTGRELMTYVYEVLPEIILAPISIRQAAYKNLFHDGLHALASLCLGYLCIALPFLLSYFLFLALVAHQPILLFISIFILSIYVLLGIWSHPGMSHPQKVRLSLLVPMYFVPFYILTVTYLAVAVTTIVHAAWIRLPGISRLGKKAFSH